MVSKMNEGEIKMKMRYILTKDGYTAGWGSEIYLLGAFDDKETAEKIAEECKGTVTEIEANRFFPLSRTSYYECMSNDYYLGRYVE